MGKDNYPPYIVLVTARKVQRFMTVNIGHLEIGLQAPLTIIAGPCVIEDERITLQTASELKQILKDYPTQFIFKSSYRKANRTSKNGFTGLPFEEALDILNKIRVELEIPVLTDVHSELEIPIVAEIVDVLQIPAFLSRQTDLLRAAGLTGRAVNIKKGQFLAPQDMASAAEKVRDTGNEKILLTERGASFGYRNLVVDMRSLIIMQQTGYPVVFDATHSIQIPGGLGNASGGQPEFILPLARAALATGAVSAIFMEVHPNPDKALSDGASQLPLKKFREVIEQLVSLYQFIQE